MMKAVIMAGGEGSRLRPLTCDLPKPMARLCGRPMLEYILDLLENHGVNRAALTLRYLPDRIVGHFPDGRYKDIALDFVEETSPLGTAGSVKNACVPEDDNILVISGDALCDFDLSAFAEAHLASGAAVSIIGKRVEDPREYGLIDADEKGNVAGFIEKPAFSQAVSDIANTGIYILSKRALDYIPEGMMYDFAKDLFPLLLERGETLHCWQGEGYWCDIGDLDTYISCQKDMLYGRVKCGFRPPREQNYQPGSGAGARGIATIRQPVYIGHNVRIEDDVLIESGSVIDDGCVVGRGARISGSILLPGVHIAPRARLTGALVCAGASIKTGAMLFEGATVGAESVIGEQATLAPGVKIWNRKRVPEGAKVTEHLKLGGRSRDFFDDDGITGQIGVELTPEFCARVGAAVGSLNPKTRVAAGCTPHRGAEVLKAAFQAGVQSTGAQVVDFGSNFQAQFAFSMNFCALEAGVFIRGDNRAWLKVVGEGGLPASRALERGVEGLLSRGEFVRATPDSMGDRVEMAGMSALYQSQLMRFAPGGLGGFSVQVKSKNLTLQALLRDTLGKLGCDSREGEESVVVEVNSQGDRLRIYDPEAGTVRYHTILMACASGEMDRGLDIALPFDAPRVIEGQAKVMGRRIYRYLNTPADDSDQEARKLARTQMWSRDALMQAVMFLHLARRYGGIAPLVGQMTGFDVAVRTVETPANPAGLLRQMSPHSPGAIAEGVLFRQPHGVVLIQPLKRGGGLRILAESVSSETARELCDSTEALIRRAMENS